MDNKQTSNKKRSVKHHYLPRHYLKGFMGTDGLLHVYDKERDMLLPKPLTPDALFFENNLNTLELPSGENSDFLEELYTFVENNSWESFDRIRKSNANKAVSLLDQMGLFHFLLFLHWRIPANRTYLDKLSRDLFNEGNVLDFFKLVDKLGRDAPREIKQELRDSQDFKKIVRMVAPFAPFYEKNWSEQFRNWRILYAGDGGNWNLVGDNPIVTSGCHDHDPKMCLNEFIFPISGSVMVVASKKSIQKELPPEFFIQFGAAIIKRANRFVACGKRDYLEAIVNDYKIHVRFKKEQGIINGLISMLDRCC